MDPEPNAYQCLEFDAMHEMLDYAMRSKVDHGSACACGACLMFDRSRAILMAPYESDIYIVKSHQKKKAMKKAGG